MRTDVSHGGKRCGGVVHFSFVWDKHIRTSLLHGAVGRWVEGGGARWLSQRVTDKVDTVPLRTTRTKLVMLDTSDKHQFPLQAYSHAYLFAFKSYWKDSVRSCAQ